MTSVMKGGELKMKSVLVTAVALAFVLGISGFSLAENVMPGMKHEGATICGTNCCGDQAKTTSKAGSVRRPLKDNFPWVTQFGGG